MPSSGSSSGRHERRAAGRTAIEPVDRARVDVALHDHALAALRERQAGGVVALRGAVDQEPGAAARPTPRPPAPAPAGTASAPGPASMPSVSAGMSSASARSPNASTSAGIGAAAPPL